jgi:hypothetical protein
LGADWEWIGSKLGADLKGIGIKVAMNWQQIGSKLAANWQQIGSKLAANWQQIGSKLVLIDEKRNDLDRYHSVKHTNCTTTSTHPSVCNGGGREGSTAWQSS